MALVDSTTPASTGYKGTARPVVRSGFTARRGGHRSTSRHSRLPVEKASTSVPVPKSSSDSSSDSNTEQEVRQPLGQRKTAPNTSAVKEVSPQQMLIPSKPKQQSAKLADKTVDRQKQSPGRQMNPIVLADEQAERQENGSTIIRKKYLAISTDVESGRQLQTLVTPIPASSLKKASPSPPEDEEPERNIMARSIIAGFPRRALEKLLLHAALGNISVMKEVIAWNAKHPVEKDEIISVQPKPNEYSLHSTRTVQSRAESWEKTT